MSLVGKIHVFIFNPTFFINSKVIFLFLLQIGKFDRKDRENSVRSADVAHDQILMKNYSAPHLTGHRWTIHISHMCLVRKFKSGLCLLRQRFNPSRIEKKLNWLYFYL